MLTRVRLLLLLETVAFTMASLVHSGVLFHGYEHGKAAVAERVISVILLIGLSLTWVLTPRSARIAATTAQALAMFGTLVGLFTVAVGVGPRTVPDIAFHTGILVLLAVGIGLSFSGPA